MKASLAVIPGDGVGPEVTAEAVRVLQAIAAGFGHEFTLHEAPFGGIAIDECGDPLPPDTLELCRAADAVLLGAIGGPRWSAPDARVRPEQGLLRLRKALGRVCEPAPGQRASGTARSHDAQERSARGCRSDFRARTDRRAFILAPRLARPRPPAICAAIRWLR